MKNWIAKQINIIHWGQFVISKVQFLFTLAILLGVYKTTKLQKVLILVGGFIAIWIIGWVFNKLFREGFLKEQFKDVLIHDKKTDSNRMSS